LVEIQMRRVSVVPARGLLLGRVARARAFTLIESLLVLAVLAILCLLTVPTWINVSARVRADSAVRAIMGAMAYARAEAVRRGAPVTVCRAAEGDLCSDQPRSCGQSRAGGYDWRCGWIVASGRRTPARIAQTPRTVLRRFPATDGVSVAASQNVNALTFRPPTGQSSGSAGSFDVRSIHSPDVRRCIRVGMNARARVEAKGCT
jgi:type IV fimbrial biogenesis protein FimT